MSRLPGRQVTDFAVTHRRALKRPVAGYFRMRYGVGRRTSRAMAMLAFAALRVVRGVRRVTDVVTAPFRLVGRGVRRIGAGVRRASCAVRRCAGAD
jgi:hypothetical protein